MTAGRAGVMSKPAAAAGGGTFTINPSAQAGFLNSGDNSGVYSAARAGTGDLGVSASVGGAIQVGQWFFSDGEGGNEYECLEGFIDFSLATLTGTVSTVTLSLGLDVDSSAQDFTVEARTRDWGATLTTADYVAGASLAGLTLLATLATSGIGSTGAYKALTESGTALRDAVTAAGAGTLRILLCSDRLRGNNQPAGNEFVSFAGQNDATFKPKLVVVTS